MTSVNRLKIAFFDYPDVFEDFYTHYNVDQRLFATKWHNTGSHAWLKIIQEEIGDITWYASTLKPEFTEEVVHEYMQGKVRFIQSSYIHRKLWKLFYTSKISWRLKKYYQSYATLASYCSLLSWRIFKTLKQSKPDVILAQEYSSGKFDVLCLYAKLLGIPLITYHAGSTVDGYSGKFLRKFTLKRASWIFASGESERARLIEKFGVVSSKINIIRPPIDMGIYKPIDRKVACSQAGLDYERRYWIFVGRLDDIIKRVSAIIKAFCKIATDQPNLDLLIVGIGNDEKKIKDQVPVEFTHRVLFLGWVSDDGKKAQLYNCCECLLMASKREGFPTVIGEAFACGVPAISSDVGTISDLVIPGKTGWLFPAGDDSAMEAIYETVAAEPGQLSALRPFLRPLAEQAVSFESTTLFLKQGFNYVIAAKK